MGMFHNINRLKEKMKLSLVGAGETGIPHSQLVQMCRTKVYTAERVRDILHDWEVRSLVQSFMVKQPHSKRPVKVWRATTLIITERL